MEEKVKSGISHISKQQTEQKEKKNTFNNFTAQPNKKEEYGISCHIKDGSKQNNLLNYLTNIKKEESDISNHTNQKTKQREQNTFNNLSSYPQKSYDKKEEQGISCHIKDGSKQNNLLNQLTNIKKEESDISNHTNQKTKQREQNTFNNLSSYPQKSYDKKEGQGISCPIKDGSKQNTEQNQQKNHFHEQLPKNQDQKEVSGIPNHSKYGGKQNTEQKGQKNTFNNSMGQPQKTYHKNEDEMEIAESIYKQQFLKNKQQDSSVLLQKVEEKVKSINPHLKGIVKQDLMLSSNYTLTKNVVNQKSEIVNKLEQESQQYMKDANQKILNIQQKKLPLNKLNPQDQKDILKAALFKYFRREGCQVQITSHLKNDQTCANSYQSQLVLTGQTNKLKYLQVGINDKSYTYQKIVSDDVTKKEVISKFLKATSNQYGVSKDRITILDIQQGCQSMVNFIFSIEGLKTDQILKTAIDQYQIEFPSAYISATAKSLIDNYQISDEYFDEEYNMYWGDSYSTQIDYRGSLPRQGQGSVPQRYYFPVGFQGYGINVKKWLEEDQSWFGQDSDKNVWIVLYHATNENGLKGISSSYIKPGQNNAYGGAQCRLTNKTILSGAGANSYFSDRASGPNSSEDYGEQIQLGNKNYIIMFQCRVNPIHVRSPYNMESYYTVEQEYAKQSVRPYRILLKEV
ncbi:hypothetical protein TTHERM_00185390 (macronuclear) [Tetrahymena thermophila SB210]|uniref:Uncharacterized protein n=1 Tax=Tetrahymena thermophila (strain SB210) TaxID=312017 RepID=Q22T73_TETTS|nr:hypothetical protein TTHERM_00185390 [Tetrahymena thermophila SB210]EAR88565.3 hypothetical protein TTHERM_00185390 [Tetrahymena thermophila SB210]|eukprot:XP_001008810.3 hypothetical protein TTHERM_00185390 [Tetrahymena thermophila SB210]